MLFAADQVALPDGLSAEAQSGARSLLAKLASDPLLGESGTGVEWAAYMLATVEHETWRRFVPAEEAGRGQGKPYGVALKTVCDDGTTRQNVYYGRGYVQLTWQANYVRMGQALQLGRALQEDPDLALDPATAYSIMSCGMVKGLFTGRRLAEYITTARVDYVQARRVINGLDSAEKIASLALAWEQRLQAAAQNSTQQKPYPGPWELSQITTPGRPGL